MKNLFFITISTLFLFSCSSDDSSSSEIKKKPSKITIEQFGNEPGTFFGTFEYDGFNITKVDANNGQVVMELFYQNNRLSNFIVRNFVSNTISYGVPTYSNNLIQKLEVTEGDVVAITEYTYNNSNQIIKTSFWETGYQYPWLTHYSYDSNNNISEVYEEHNNQIYTKYEYDNNPNPFKYAFPNINLNQFSYGDMFLPKNNNIIKAYSSIGDNNYGAPEIINHIYDNDGYPIVTPGTYREYRYEY
jgi:hypothetical protein